jgi:hypothetical protein
MKNYKLTTRLKNETWINPEIKPLKRDMNLDQTRQNTHTKKKKPCIKILNTTNAICGKNCESL